MRDSIFIVRIYAHKILLPFDKRPDPFLDRSRLAISQIFHIPVNLIAVIQFFFFMSPQNIIADCICRLLDGHEQIQTIRALLCLILDRLRLLSVSDPEYTKSGDPRFTPIRNFHDREAQIPDADSLFPHDKIMRQVGLRFAFTCSVPKR